MGIYTCYIPHTRVSGVSRVTHIKFLFLVTEFDRNGGMDWLGGVLRFFACVCCYCVSSQFLVRVALIAVVVQ